MIPGVTMTDALAPSESDDFEASLDRAMGEVGRFGIDALIYDYAPVPFTPSGDIITPSVFGARNMPEDMAALWCAQGLYQRDPVQRMALGSVQPVYWSYHFEEHSALTDAAQGAVADYLRDCKLARGITVPVHLPGRGSATVSGIWRQRPSEQALRNSMLAEFMLFAHGLHDRLIRKVDAELQSTTAVRLTPRERECIQLCADGLSDKQVAHALDRSISTVVMHLQSAMRKLGARNRAQAIARAAHYGMLH
ncbi:LuxR family transcriptional regulator [Devosia sp. 2618]|uniref:helix-turn-helix transcriptional regulator n=1 Tax=Devosia sp. 2618 TaxID=3156454 RepID=UPI00339A3F56